MTLANKITILRIILIPVFIIALLQDAKSFALIIFSFTIITDALDGFIARYKKQKTPLGTFLDPLADKILLFSSYITLSYLKIIPLWVFVIIFSRDLLIVIGWIITYILTGLKEIKPRLLGKTTTVFQMLTIWFILLGLDKRFYDLMLIITIVFTVLSCIDYLITGSKKLTFQG